MKTYYPLILLLSLVSVTTLFAQSSCDLLSGNINLGGTAHDPGFQENDPVDMTATLSNGNFVVAWETRDGVDGDASGAYFRLFKEDGTSLTNASIPYNDINATGTGDQGIGGPKVVALTNGFVIGWESENGPGDTGAANDEQQDVFIRVYNNDGNPVSGSTRISVAAQEDHLMYILPLSAGGFVVLIRIDEDNTGNNDDFFIQIFNATGTAVGGLINVSGGVHDGSFQSTDVAQVMVELSNGSFAVAWEAREAADGDGDGAFFRIFNTDATPVTGVITPYTDINASGTGDQGTPGPKLISLANGDFVVGWDSEQGPGDVGPGNDDDHDVYFRVYKTDGTPVSGTTKANSDNAAEEEKLRGLIALTGGNFAVLYDADEDETGNLDDYFVRTFTPAGVAAGGSVEISGGAHINFFSTIQPNEQGFAALNNGNFVVGWAARDGADGDQSGIYYRVFNATGAAVSAVTMPYADINANGTGDQSSSGPVIKALPDGFAIAWTSGEGPGDVGPGGDDNKDVYHRVIKNDGSPFCGTTKTNTDNDAEEDILETIQPLNNGDFVVIYRDDEDVENKDDFFARVIGGAPLSAVCPTIGEMTITPACEGAPYTITVSGLENMAKADNNERDYGLTFHALLSLGGDIYETLDFFVIGTVPFSALSNGGTTATFTPPFIDDLNLLIVARLDAVPAAANCRPQTSLTRVIENKPFIQLAAPPHSCVDAGVQMGLGSASPAGGVFSGPGITDGGNGTYSLDPAAAGVGMHQLTYTVTSALCGATFETRDFEIFAKPTVAFAAPANLCFDAGLQTGLGSGTPAGGVYAGTGVTDGGNGMTYSFDPTVAGVGSHTIAYTYTDGNGCSAMASGVVEVFAMPAVTFIALNDLKVDAGAQTGLSGGTPAEGSATDDMGGYSGPGVTDGGNGMTYAFDPAVAGIGVHTITYTYTDGNGCMAMASDEVEVLPGGLVITPIDNINDLNADGTGISVGQEVAIQGVVHCSDFLESAEIQFYVLETNGDGIGVYAAQTLNDYVPMEGDEVIIEGNISQFNGSLEITPTNITLVSQNNDLVTPVVVNALTEPLENKLVTLEINDANSQTVQLFTFNGGFFLELPSASQGTLGVRVWNSTGISAEFLANYASRTDISLYRITGIVVQEDPEAPFDGSYFLYPCSEQSFEFVVATQEPIWATELLLFPNPTGDQLQVKAPVMIETLCLRDLQGKVLHRSEIQGQEHTLDMSKLPQGVYQLQLMSEGGMVNRKVVKQ